MRAIHTKHNGARHNQRGGEEEDNDGTAGTQLPEDKDSEESGDHERRLQRGLGGGWEKGENRVRGGWEEGGWRVGGGWEEGGRRVGGGWEEGGRKGSRVGEGWAGVGRG